MQRHGLLAEGRQQRLDPGGHILFNQQALVCARALERKLAVHVPDQHALDWHMCATQYERLIRGVGQMLGLDARRRLDFDKLGPAAITAEHVGDHRKVAVPHRWLMQDRIAARGEDT